MPANEEASHNEEYGLNLSDMQVKVTSMEHTATFQLYNTVAAREFYDQLPLELELTNFRDAQWMFYPPKKLDVTAREAYHEGKKGELSYYEPWGDVFMLYKYFYAGDEMHRLGINVTGIEEIEEMSGSVSSIAILSMIRSAFERGMARDALLRNLSLISSTGMGDWRPPRGCG